MRAKLLSSALALGCAALAGCSLVYNGAHYQGGTATDTGMGGNDSGTPSDAGVDVGPGEDTGVDGGPDAGPACHDIPSCPTMGTYCDIATMTCRPGCDDNSDCTGGAACDTTSHICGTGACTSSAMCMGDTYCHVSGTTGACAPCDGDGDHYYAADAGLGCARLSHLNGGDCDDTNSAIFPDARIDCSTPFAESCPIGIAFATDPGVTVHEVGLSPSSVVFADSGALVAPRGPVWVAAGDDSTLLPSGTPNGYVGFVGQAMDGTSRFVYGVPLRFSGAAGTPEVLFDQFQVGAAAFSRTRDGSGSPVMLLSAVATPGANAMGMVLGPVNPSPLNWGAQTMTGYATVPFVGGGTSASVGGLNSVGAPALVGIFGDASGGNPSVMAGTPVELVRTGVANVVGGTWIASAGTAAIWVSESQGTTPTIGRVGVWNGSESGVSPPEIDLDSFTSTSPVTVVSPNFRGDIDSRRIGGSEHFVAIVPVAATTMPPTGRLALIRWSWPVPGMNEPVAPHLSGAASDLTIHELDVGTTHRINGFAGASVFILSDANAVVAYQDNSGIVVRPIPVVADPTATVESAPTLLMLPQGIGETFVSVELAAGLYPQASGPAIGRIVVTAMVEHGPAGSIHEIRARAIEACLTMP